MTYSYPRPCCHKIATSRLALDSPLPDYYFQTRKFIEVSFFEFGPVKKNHLSLKFDDVFLSDNCGAPLFVFEGLGTGSINSSVCEKEKDLGSRTSNPGERF
jgi:hypothetical protein